MTDVRQRRGRREQPVDPSAPEHQRRFALALRALRDQCGQPPYRELQRLANCSHSVLWTSASGRELPSWENTSGYVRGCLRYAGRPEDSIAADLADWETRWRRASNGADIPAIHVVSASPPASELYRELRADLTSGRSAHAVAEADRVAEVSSDPEVLATALLFQIGGLINLDAPAGCPPLVERANGLVRQIPDPRMVGEYHALAGYVAYRSGALECAVTHLALSGRALARANPSLESADAWHDLAEIYSLTGFAGRALTAVNRSRKVGAAAGLSRFEHFAPYIDVRYALSLDHRGDTRGCVRVLQRVVDETADLIRNGQLPIAWPIARPYLQYSAARLAVLGEPTSVDPALFDLSGEAEGAVVDGILTLTEVCTSIVGREADEALDMIASASIVDDPLGAAELLRLRSLAHTAAGQHREALEVERHAFHRAARQTDKLHDILLDEIDQRATADLWSPAQVEYDTASLIDSLTGLPNRRRLVQAMLELGTQRRSAVLGSLAVDAYPDIAEGYGQHRADLLLQQLARSLSRMLRGDDMLARVDTDEFALLLPDTDPASADVIGRQLANAVSSECHAVLSATATLSVGWAAIDGRVGFEAAYRRARSSAAGGG